MSPQWLVGTSFLGYGCTITVGIGVPIPVLSEEILRYVAVRDADIFTPIVDYSDSYSQVKPDILGEVSYAQLKSGTIRFEGQDVPTVPLSSVVRAREIAERLKKWIQKGKFTLGEPQQLLPSV